MFYSVIPLILEGGRRQEGISHEISQFAPMRIPLHQPIYLLERMGVVARKPPKVESWQIQGLHIVHYLRVPDLQNRGVRDGQVI